MDEYSWEIIPGHVIMITLAIISIFGTINIIWATWRNSSLHGTCNYLLAINAISDSVHQCSHFIHGYILFSGIATIPRLTCSYLSSASLFGLNTGMICLFFIGIDRLFSVLAPTKHRNCNKKLYYSLMILFNLAFNGGIFWIVYDYALNHPQEKTTCFIPDVMGGTSANYWFISCIILNFSTIICYIIVGCILKSNSQSLNPTRKIFKAITFIMLMIFCGWTINAISRVYFIFATFEPKINWIAAVYFGIFVNIACTSNYFILFKFSSDYRIIFKRYLNNLIWTVGGKRPFDDVNKTTSVSQIYHKSVTTFN